mmetsp:Transcript_779/g.2259  ORF Transcript_779/g.2259 Transcript_779/m.2259 type:complete len:85 (+) Transcript_779:679-933(+)
MHCLIPITEKAVPLRLINVGKPFKMKIVMFSPSQKVVPCPISTSSKQQAHAALPSTNRAEKYFVPFFPDRVLLQPAASEQHAYT